MSFLTRLVSLEIYRLQFQVRIGRWRAYKDVGSPWIVGRLPDLNGEPSVPNGFLTVIL